MGNNIKVYLGTIEKNNNLIGVLGIYNNSDELYKGYKKYFNKKENINNIHLLIYKWGISKLRFLHQNMKLKSHFCELIIDNNVIYNWIKKDECDDESTKEFIALLLELSLMPLELEIFYENNITEYLNYTYNLISKEKIYSNVVELF